MPERQAAGGVGRRSGWVVQGGAVLLLSFAAMALPGSATAREWLAPVHQPAPSITVADTPDDSAEAIGVDISIADLMADGSELSGVAPRTATSGIGSDVERDLFSDGTPLNAKGQPPPEDDQQYLY